MKILSVLLLLPLATVPALLVGCESAPPDDSGVVEVRDLPLTHISADEATAALRKKLTGDATVSPNKRNNSVIVTGTTSAVRRAEELLKQIDIPKADASKKE